VLPDPTSAKVSVRTLGGEVVLEAKFAHDTRVRDLRSRIAVGENQEIKLFHEGRELHDADCLSEVGITRESTVNLVRVQKPPRPVVRTRSPSPRCSCFTSDCMAELTAARNSATSQSCEKEMLYAQAPGKRPIATVASLASGRALWAASHRQSPCRGIAA